MTTGQNKRRAILKQALLSLLVLVSLVVAFLAPLDRLGATYLDSAFERALLGFAVARGLNGVISVAQGTEFAIQPAGVGINFAPGEILDPVNDLVERFSWIMLLSSSSLGVQKVLLSISAWQWLIVSLTVVAMAYLASLWWKQQASGALRVYLSRLFVLLLVLRFSVPLVAVMNEWVYSEFLDERFQSASSGLQQVSDEISEINQQTQQRAQEAPNEPQGFVDRAITMYNSAIAQVDFEQRMQRYKAAAEEITLHAINLIVVFILQTILLPLLFLWLIVYLFRRLLSLRSL